MCMAFAPNGKGHSIRGAELRKFSASSDQTAGLFNRENTMARINGDSATSLR
jgi:hypothetical protein